MRKRNPAADPVYPGKHLHEDILFKRAISKMGIADALKMSRQALYGVLNGKQPTPPE